MRCKKASPNDEAFLFVELAARLRDEVNELKKELRAMDAAGVR